MRTRHSLVVDVRPVFALIEGVAFWTAVLIAFAYPPLLIVLDRGVIDHAALLGIVVVHVLALLLGHRHGNRQR